MDQRPIQRGSASGGSKSGSYEQRIERMERLIDDLLSYARAGQAATNYTTVDVRHMVGEHEIAALATRLQPELDMAVSPFMPRAPH